MESKKYIRFDWAMKRLLRNKVNFVVLEGFLTTLLNEEIKIHRLLESESNQESGYDKQNRVDMLAENSKGEFIIIEIQNSNEQAYFQRILFGTSKLVVEYIEKGKGYHNIRKIYSVNIVYFDLRDNEDVVYHGKTEFRGIHNGDLLKLNHFQMKLFNTDDPSKLYPEYYILKVDDFNRVATTPLEEWIYYLNTGEIQEKITAPGLKEVKERLKLDSMTKEQLDRYYKDIDNLISIRSSIDMARGEGRLEGEAEGRAEGKAEEKKNNARAMKKNNISIDIIAKCTGLSIKEIEVL